MAGDSNVGSAALYEAGDQRNSKETDQDKAERFEEGKKNAHDPNDPKDERSIANRLANETKKNKEDDDSGKSEEDKLRDQDATLPAKSHGNKPSRGAEIDQELREEEAEILKKKGSFGPSV